MYGQMPDFRRPVERHSGGPGVYVVWAFHSDLSSPQSDGSPYYHRPDGNEKSSALTPFHSLRQSQGNGPNTVEFRVEYARDLFESKQEEVIPGVHSWEKVVHESPRYGWQDLVRPCILFFGGFVYVQVSVH